MDFDAYIESLRCDQRPMAYIELDKKQEIDYLIRERPRFYRVMKAIPQGLGSLRLLDIGPTPFTLYLKQVFPNYDVWALDRTDLLLDRFERGGVTLRVCDLDSEPIPFADSFFDVVIFTEVLEHVFAPPSGILQEVRRIMRAGGLLILSVPNIVRLAQRARMLFGYSPLPHADSQLKRDWVHGHGHVHEYTMQEITDILTGCGLKIESRQWLSSTVKGMLVRRGHNRVRLLAGAARAAAQRLWPSLGTTNFILCRK